DTCRLRITSIVSHEAPVTSRHNRPHRMIRFETRRRWHPNGRGLGPGASCSITANTGSWTRASSADIMVGNLRRSDCFGVHPLGQHGPTSDRWMVTYPRDPQAHLVTLPDAHVSRGDVL